MTTVSSAFYAYKARFLASLIVLFPIILFLIIRFPELWIERKSIISILTSFGIIHFLGEAGRDAGKRKEAWLFKRWAGKPSISILRFRNTWLDPITHKRYLTELSKNLKIRKKLTKAFENKNPQLADEIYESFCRFLIERTRDTKKFSILFTENVSYGFRRNLWAMKPFALFILFSLSFFQLFEITLNLRGGIAIKEITTGLFIFDLILIFLWILKINPAWVKIPADAYASRLFESIAFIKRDKD